ncbi:MAG: efflux RND transporter periplasmic adaptor subunit [Alcanivoracaceae bacterium]|nr:efflux RND transporter periplasmic adaptor subunit [Alcanivoracaceae bacterium]
MREITLARHTRITLGVALAFAAIIALIYLLAPQAHHKERQQTRITLDIVPVTHDRQRLLIQARGEAQPARQIPLVARVSGTVESLSAAFVDGGRVQAGDELLVLADEDYQLALARRRNDVSAANLHLQEVKAKARVAERVNGKNASAYARLVPHLHEARTRLEAAEAALESAELELARTRISAPFDGRLSSVAVRSGQVVNAGQLVASLYSADLLEVRLPVPESWLALLPLPDKGGVFESPVPVTLRARYAGDMRRWQGALVRSEGGLDRNQMMTLVAQVPATAGDITLEPGTWLEAEISGREVARVARLPQSVLGHDQRVWVVNGDGRLERRHVSVLYLNDEYVFIDRGLNEGDEVVLEGGLRLLEGTLVNAKRPWMPDDQVSALLP